MNVINTLKSLGAKTQNNNNISTEGRQYNTGADKHGYAFIESDSNDFTYKSVYETLRNFKTAGTYSGVPGYKGNPGDLESDFNTYDTPGHKYFKIFFYFDNKDADVDNSNYIFQKSGGLLAPTWELLEPIISDSDDGTNNVKIEDVADKLWQYSSAYSYLIINDEQERAEKLQQFVYLLSNISSMSPWYFSSIEGISDALNRPQLGSNSFQFEEERKQIIINCLEDAFDDRISTLLDLYRDIAFSWVLKKEILPSNLRKFDMGIYIFESPIHNIHHYGGGSNGGFKKITNPTQQQPTEEIASYKYLEFHNCEIDYNSSKEAYGSIDNKEGFQLTHKIVIKYDDCYESRYNEQMQRVIGDMVALDLANYSEKSEGFTQQEDNPELMAMFNEKSDSYKNATGVGESVDKGRSGTGPLRNMVGEFVGRYAGEAASKIKKLLTGNMFGLSITKLSQQANEALKGHLWSTIGAVKQYTKSDNYDKKYQLKYVNEIGNIFKAKSAIKNI